MSVIKNIAIIDKNGLTTTYDVGGQSQNIDYNSSNVKNKLDSLKSAAYADKGIANGVAELDGTGKVPTSQLPSSQGKNNVEEYENYESFPEEGESEVIYIDLSTNITYRQDTTEQIYITLSSGGSGGVEEYEDAEHFPAEGETDIIYIDAETNTTYRQDSTENDYVAIGSSLTLGETETTAYRGDRGKSAYDHSQLTSGNPHQVTKTDVGLSNVGNYKSLDVSASNPLSVTEQEFARQNLGLATIKGFTATVDVTGDGSVTFHDASFNEDSILIGVYTQQGYIYSNITDDAEAHTITITYDVTEIPTNFKVTIVVLSDNSLISSDTTRQLGIGQILVPEENE